MLFYALEPLCDHLLDPDKEVYFFLNGNEKLKIEVKKNTFSRNNLTEMKDIILVSELQKTFLEVLKAIKTIPPMILMDEVGSIKELLKAYLCVSWCKEYTHQELLKRIREEEHQTSLKKG
jgi:Cu2+-containing amine oxidase